MSKEFYVVRLKSSLQSLLSKLEEFLRLVEQGEQPSGLFLFMTKDEIHAPFDCLWNLGLPGDARKLAGALLALQQWIVIPQLDEVFAEIAESEPAKTEWYRQLFGEFPSVKELADTKEERQEVYSKVVSHLRALVEHARQIHEATNFADEEQLIKSVAGSQAPAPPCEKTEQRKTGDEVNEKATKPAKKKRRRHANQKPTPVTPKQLDAMQLYGEHKGNIAAAAKAAGVSRAAMMKLIQKAQKKLGKQAVEKVKTTPLPEDHRGQVAVENRVDEED
jgi:predicted DNA-binding protein (UPF0251 family)